MKKLKNILQYNLLYFFLIIILVIYVLFFVKYYKIKSKYNLNTKSIKGYIYYIKKDKDNYVLKIKGKENIIVYYYINNNINFKYGDYILINGYIKEIDSNNNFNLFNYKNYLLSKKIYYSFNASSIKIIKRTNNIFYKIKNKTINRINKCKYSKKYIKTFIVGDKNDIDNEILIKSKKLGIIHLLCISSMHVSLIVLLIEKLIKNRRINIIITILFLFFYIFLTSFQISLIRASILFIFNKFKFFSFNKFYLLFIFILLIINPFLIYDNGFLFSFIISFFIINYSNNKLNILKSSFISFLSSLPLIINTNFEINLISIFVNIIFIPIVSYIIFPLSLLTFIIPSLDSLTYKVLINFEKLINLFNKINLFKINTSNIFLLIIIIYYLFLYLSINYKKCRLIILIIIVYFFINNYYIFGNKIYFINVKQGDSILLKNKIKNILIDTGGSFYNSNIFDREVSPFLKSTGVKKIDVLILTHGDYDHMGEAINLVNNFKVEKVIFNCGPYNDLEKALIKVLDKKKIEYYSCIKELNIDKNKLYFLQTKEYDNENDNSNVIYTELNGYKFMFMGDASVTTEKEILDKYNLPDIDVLKVGHHGSKTSSSTEFIDEINPKYSIISVGKNNRYGHPNKEVLENLEQSKIYRTDQDGSIMFKIKNNKLKIETCEP